MLWGNQTVTGRWTHVFSPQLFSRLIALYSEYHSRITVDLLDLPLAIDNKVREVTLKSDFDYFASDRHTLRSGADLSFYRFNYGSQFDEYKSTLSTKPFLLNSYIQDDWQLSSLTEAQLGVRAAYYSDGSDHSRKSTFFPASFPTGQCADQAERVAHIDSICSSYHPRDLAALTPGSPQTTP